MSEPHIDALSINTLRFLAVDAVEKARSGHPGMPMGAAPMAYALWTRLLRFDPQAPRWPDRDRFVLSAGHGSMLLYGLLHLAGFGLTLEDLKSFRQWGSKTPGHPEFGETPGVETTTGPLGQGISAAVGMAIAERHLAARYNRPGFEVVDHWTYVIAGDGDLMEGVSAEAASLAGHLGLGRLVVLYDDNRITIEGGTDLTFSEDVEARFRAYGWQTLTVEDGNDPDAVEAALRQARAEPDRPSLIRVRTHIGYGSPGKQDSADAHGAPLGPDEVRRTKERLGWPAEPEFHVPDRAREPFRRAAERGRAERERWEALMARYREQHPDLAAEFERRMAGELPDGWDQAVPTFDPDAKGVATRGAGGKVLNALAARVPELMGGSADLGPSTKTLLNGEDDFSRHTPAGRNLRFGVREHAMAAVLNGMANHGGFRPFGSTFFVFSDYLRPSLRLAALMKLPVIHVFTHDSIFVGEDGPTHQPVEHLASLRAMPNLVVLRPADANETAEAWRVALERTGGPTALVLTRQNVPVLDRGALAPASGLRRGGYVLREASAGPEGVRMILVATGSEVHLALQAADRLEADGVPTRVVSLPSWELFEEQDPAYRDEVLPSAVPARVAVEAGSPFGWDRYAGPAGAVVAIDRFGASAPAGVLAERFGFTVDNVVSTARRVLERAG
ncbi:transketolase [Deferrisoma camini]|uniref:transketolase n=1 Tax=Deferrisoma camini TaxID=1035120 RepID=UPI00046D26EE|nr:transketolase [Deferrisoma camini]